jgi:hypothetical protein
MLQEVAGEISNDSHREKRGDSGIKEVSMWKFEARKDDVVICKAESRDYFPIKMLMVGCAIYADWVVISFNDSTIVADKPQVAEIEFLKYLVGKETK